MEEKNGRIKFAFRAIWRKKFSIKKVIKWICFNSLKIEWKYGIKRNWIIQIDIKLRVIIKVVKRIRI